MTRPARHLLAPLALAAVLAAPAAVGERYGLFVGVNEFKSSSATALSGCVWDALRMRDAWTRGGGCTETNTAIFLDAGATTNAVRSHLHALATAAQPGDTVLFTQSSHGGQYDETGGSVLCLHDANWSDAEFAADLSLFRSNVTVIVFLDACNSGGMFKDTNDIATASSSVSTRAAPLNAAESGTVSDVTPVWNFAMNVQAAMRRRRSSGATRGAGDPLGPDVAWITAADWDESSYDGVHGGKVTMSLVAGWERAAADTNADESVSFGELAAWVLADTNIASHVQTLGDELLDATQAGTAFDVDTFRLLHANGELGGFLGSCPADLAIPDGIATICPAAFAADTSDASSLSSVTFPASLTSIRDWAFWGCTALTNAVFLGNRANVSIPRNAFYYSPAYAVVFPVPANDDFANATAISGALGSVTASTAYATMESDEAWMWTYFGYGDYYLTYPNYEAHTVWWAWTAEEDGIAWFDTYGSNFGRGVATLMLVGQGPDPDNLTLLAANRYAYRATRSYAKVFVKAGETYHIGVRGYLSEEGTAVLNWEAKYYQPTPLAVESSSAPAATNDVGVLFDFGALYVNGKTSFTADQTLTLRLPEGVTGGDVSGVYWDISLLSGAEGQDSQYFWIDWDDVEDGTAINLKAFIDEEAIGLPAATAELLGAALAAPAADTLSITNVVDGFYYGVSASSDLAALSDVEPSRAKAANGMVAAPVARPVGDVSTGDRGFFRLHVCDEPGEP